jgi:hypothetical protein
MDNWASWSYTTVFDAGLFEVQKRSKAFDLAAVEHVHGFAVLEQGHGRRRRRIGRQNIPQVGDGCFIAAREDGGHLRGFRRMLERHSNSRARASSGTAAHGIDDHQDGTTAGRQEPVDVGGSASLLYTVTGEVGAHGSDENFGIGHDSILAGASGVRPGVQFIL